MIADNVILFIILLVLAYAFNDSWIAEMLIFFFSVYNAYVAVPLITTEAGAYQVMFFVLIGIYAVGNMLDWATRKKTGVV